MTHNIWYVVRRFPGSCDDHAEARVWQGFCCGTHACFSSRPLPSCCRQRCLQAIMHEAQRAYCTLGCRRHGNKVSILCFCCHGVGGHEVFGDDRPLYSIIGVGTGGGNDEAFPCVAGPSCRMNTQSSAIPACDGVSSSPTVDVA